ncbi:MAG: hypothetical protein SGI92_08250 [Bryobacteraceae bacterium]|nr:hypothetical protein [Bryobacteraceae bacterium]
MLLAESRKPAVAGMYMAVRDTTASKNPVARKQRTRSVPAGTHVIFDEQPADCWNPAWLDDGQEWFVDASHFRPLAAPKFQVRYAW